MDAVGRQPEPFAARELRDRELPFNEVAPQRPEARGHDRIARVEQLPILPIGDDHAGFLEALPDSRDPVGEPSAFQAERRRGACLGAARADRLVHRVVRVDGSPGEHVRAPYEVGADVPPHHEYLEARRRVPYEHDGRGIAWFRQSATPNDSLGSLISGEGQWNLVPKGGLEPPRA